MTTSTLPVPVRYASTTMPVRRFSVAEYQRMIADGYFGEDERIELLEGWIVPKMPKNPPHDAYVHRAARIITQRLPAGWHVRIQSAINTGDSQPEPDIAVVPGDELDYERRLPGPQDIALLVEVSQSTLTDDRGIMQRIYARAGIPAYWIVNLIDRQIEVFTDPSGSIPIPAYRQTGVARANQTIPLMIAGVDKGPVPITDILP